MHSTVGPLGEAFARTVAERGDRLALRSLSEGETLSFRQLRERIDAWKLELEVTPGALAALAVGNRTLFAELFFALRELGQIVVLLDEGASIRDRVETCRLLGVDTLYDLSGIGDKTLPRGLSRITIGEPASLEPAPDTAVVKLTSGSTGKPSGVCLDEEALVAGIRQIAEGMEIESDDRILLAIPLSHSYGFDNGILSLAMLGTPLILERSFFPSPLLAALRDGDATIFPAVPPMIHALAQTEWPEEIPLRKVLSAGGPLPAEFAAAFAAASGRTVHQFYGSTETGGISFETAPDRPEADGTVGHPLPGVSVNIGAGGQIEVQSRACLTAYLGAPPRGEEPVSLGDTGELTAEGRLKLTGRAQDLLNVGGRRVSAGAIEHGLRRIAAVQDAAVLAVDDPLRGDRVVAFVVTDGERVPAGELPRGLSARTIHRVDALPYDPRGKLDRDELRRIFEDA